MSQIIVQLKYDEIEQGLSSAEQHRRASRPSISKLNTYLNQYYPNLVRSPSNIFASCTIFTNSLNDTQLWDLINNLNELEFVTNTQYIGD